MAYQLSNVHLLVNWLEKQRNIESSRTFLITFVQQLLEDPKEMSHAERRDSPGVPSYVAAIPGTSAFVAYSVIEQYHAVRIHDIDDCGFDDIEEFLESEWPQDDE